MAETKEPTKAELAEALLKATQMLKDQGELLATQGREIAQLKAPSNGVAFNYTSDRDKTSYFGWVRARERCQVNRDMVDGKKLITQAFVYEAGEVFQHEVDQLWSDDPFEPVELVGYEDQEQTRPITKPNVEALKTVLDMSQRRHARIVQQTGLRRASEF
jgi:hypothetical protein